MPPLVEDNRLDAQYPNATYINLPIRPRLSTRQIFRTIRATSATTTRESSGCGGSGTRGRPSYSKAPGDRRQCDRQRLSRRARRSRRRSIRRIRRRTRRRCAGSRSRSGSSTPRISVLNHSRSDRTSRTSFDTYGGFGHRQWPAIGGRRGERVMSTATTHTPRRPRPRSRSRAP